MVSGWAWNDKVGLLRRMSGVGHGHNYSPKMGNRYWPMFDLRLTTPDLDLRHLTEADLASLAAILPDDAEQDPSSTLYPGLTETGIAG